MGRARGAMKSYAAAIPAYEAAPSIGDVVRRTLPILSHVLVVDDGSKDVTAEEARRAGAEVHRFPANRGKGAALLAAFEILFARGVEGVVTLDADGQHIPEEIPRLLDVAVNADLVLGTREHLFGAMSRLRRVSNRLSSGAISLAAGRRLSDVQTGFRFYSHHLFATTGFPERRFDAESAVVVRAARLGLRIATVPVRLAFADGRTTSHYRPVVDSLLIARAVVRARLTTP
jgi:glycosyltransferase involved in cell wall biosynthesis